MEVLAAVQERNLAYLFANEKATQCSGWLLAVVPLTLNYCQINVDGMSVLSACSSDNQRERPLLLLVADGHRQRGSA